MICGTVKRFLLFGDHDGDVFATGGEMEIIQVSETVAYYCNAYLCLVVRVHNFQCNAK